MDRVICPVFIPQARGSVSMRSHTLKQHWAHGVVDSLPPTLYFITGSTMEAKVGGDSRLVLPTFQPPGRESGSKAVLSGLLCFQRGLAAISWGQTWKTDAPVWRTESGSETTVLGICKIWQIVTGEKLQSRVRHRGGDRFLTSPYWLNMRMTWSVMLKMFLQSKFGIPGSLCSSGPLYRKLRMSSVVKSVSSRLSSMKCVTVGFLRVSCSDGDRSRVTLCNKNAKRYAV